MSAFRSTSAAILLGLVASLGGSASAQPFAIPPAPATLVSDFAGLLTPAERRALEEKLVAFDDSTSTQIVVVIFTTLDGANPGETATAIGRSWGVGQDDADNGVVLLVSVEDREVFIATGYGAEAVITDALAGRIIRNVIAPRFRDGRYFAGIDDATDALMAAASGEFAAAEIEREGPAVGDILLVFAILLVLLVVVTAMSSKNGGGGWRSGPGWIVLPGGPGGWSGGGLGGGGFGGGGFGGFGGGGFGGGGAGGSW